MHLESSQSSSIAQTPHVSFIMPCYNEEEAIRYTIPHLTAAFTEAGYRIELVAVDNGSTDRTGEIIQEMAAQDPRIVHHRVDKNQGYGHGLLSGIPRCTAPWVGMICADGQIDPQDVVHLFEAVRVTNGRAIGKARRRFRMDGLRRKVVSIFYNAFVRLLWPKLDSIDVNGTPKIIPRNALSAMRLESKNWLLDPEIMVKSHYLGLRVLEFNVFARMRGLGISHVRASTCWEFFSKLIAARFTGRWKRQVKGQAMEPFEENPPASMAPHSAAVAAGIE